MQELPNCPSCNSEYTYEDGSLLICPECAHEWNPDAVDEDALIVKDAYGVTLTEGDDVTVIKDLKIKGSSTVIKVGTKIKSIRLVESNVEHNIDCKIAGVGAIKVAQKYVKKA